MAQIKNNLLTASNNTGLSSYLPGNFRLGAGGGGGKSWGPKKPVNQTGMIGVNPWQNTPTTDNSKLDFGSVNPLMKFNTPGLSSAMQGMTMDSGGNLVAKPAAPQQTTQPTQSFSPQPTASVQQAPNQSQQLESIRLQALGIQDLLNQKKQAESATKTKSTQPTEFFPGVLQDLLGASRPTAEQEEARRLMQETAMGNRQIADQAALLSKQYGDEIARVGQLGAGAVAGNLSTGTNVVGSGNAAIASQSASQRMQALSQAQQAALKGTEQQLTAQEQQAQALRPSLEATLTQQQQQISGLGTAAGLGAPTQVQPGSTLFSPVSGAEVAGGLGGWANYTTAQQVQSLIEQYPDAGVVYNPNLTPQQNAQIIQQAIAGSPSYQRGTFGAAGAGSYIGAQQLGAAGALTGQVAQLQSQGAAADANFNLMLSILKKGQINDLNVPILNQLTQNISRGLASDSDVVAFRSALQTVRSQYAAILGGGTPTNETLAMATEKIPDTVSAAALQQVEQTMKAMVNNTVASYNQTIGQYSGGGYGGGSSFAEQW
jgi:hypothetical protein